MSINHGIYNLEQGTALTAPQSCESGVICMVGTAPIHMLDDPQSAVNTPLLATSSREGQQVCGYSRDMSFTTNILNYILANAFDVAPAIFINVLDPRKHRTAFEEQTVPVEFLTATVPVGGALRDDTLKVALPDGTDLQPETDYTAIITDDDTLQINLTLQGAGASATSVVVSGYRLDPSKVTKDDIIGQVNVSTGEESGMEVIRQVYPKLGIIPTLLIAPGFSDIPEVGMALAAKARSVSGMFKAVAYVDLDTEDCRKYTDVKTEKEEAGATAESEYPVWPCDRYGGMVFPKSAMFAALTAYWDSVNGNVPYASPSNKPLPITGNCLKDGTPVYLDQAQANVLNSFGVSTAINLKGYKSWGNYTGAYPSTGDPKDFWLCCRRMFNWYENSVIINYFSKVDDPMNRRLIENFIDSENIRMSAYVANQQLAGFKVEYLEEDNPATDIIAGKITFRVHFAPFTPAQEIWTKITFDVDMLQSALLGGAAA